MALRKCAMCGKELGMNDGYQEIDKDVVICGPCAKQRNQRKRDIEEKGYEEWQYDLLVTTGYDFEGYRIVEYLGAYVGDGILGTGMVAETLASFSDLTGTKSNTLANKAAGARYAASSNLQSKVKRVGANAIIGLGFNMYVIGAAMIGACAYGTAVRVEKI